MRILSFKYAPHGNEVKIYPTKNTRIMDIDYLIKKTTWNLDNIKYLDYLRWLKNEYACEKINACNELFEKSNVRRYKEDVRNKNKER